VLSTIHVACAKRCVCFDSSATELAQGQCEVDGDCNSNGKSGKGCDQSSTQTACTCKDGLDSCKQLGSCIPFCKSAQAKKQLETANAQVVVCDPFLPNTCSGGLVCQTSSAGVQLVCRDGEGFVPVEVGGVCVPAQRELLSARFSADGKQVTVSLNAAARSCICMQLPVQQHCAWRKGMVQCLGPCADCAAGQLCYAEARRQA
jgi:hypothetical protein